jgi:DNA (cytosine-5)-methyltransferase 3A
MKKNSKPRIKQSTQYNILSVCDGMSCGQIALREIGIQYGKYYASEIDRHAIRQTQLNFPSTVQLGDIEGWRDWDIDWASIMLILSGTPCTGFSSCGKHLNFDDPQSRLFFVFVDILNHVKKFNPGVRFLFENVRMKSWCKRIISEALGVRPVFINSSFVSAQERKRLYWTNIRTKEVGLFRDVHTDIPQPDDRKILLKDILDDSVAEKYYLSETKIRAIENAHKNFTPKISPQKAGCLTKNYGEKGGLDASATFISIDGKAPAQRRGGTHSLDKKHNYQVVQLNPNTEEGCGAHAILQHGRGFNKGGLHASKSPTLTANDWQDNNHLLSSGSVRRLTPAECARLQTVPEWYVWKCSDTQQYRMCGNGWTIEVIKHILKYLKQN